MGTQPNLLAFNGLEMETPVLETLRMELKPRPWLILAGVAFSGLLLLAVGFSLPESEAKFPLLLGILGMVLYSSWHRWRSEPRLQITSSAIRILSPLGWSTPLSNIANISLASRSGIHFLFHDLRLVKPEKAALKFQQNMMKHGWHFELAGPINVHGEQISRACNILPEKLSDQQSLEQSSNSVEVFHHMLAEDGNKPFLSKTLVIINVLVFGLMVALGVSIFQPSVDSLKVWGANYGPLTFRGEAWRLFTSIFLHIGLIHLGINMLVLFRIGPFLEMILGRWAFLLVYLASGIGGSIASVWWNELGVSAGASGALFGMFGGLLGYLVVRPPAVPKEVNGKLKSWAFQFIFLNIALMFGLNGIDQAAHVGGAGFGFFFGIILGVLPGQFRNLPELARNGLVLAVMVATIWGAGVAVSRQVVPAMRAYDTFEDFRIDEKSLQEEFARNYEKTRDGKITEKQFADYLQQKSLPAWKSYLQRFEDCDRLPRKFKPWFGDFMQYLKTRIKGQELLLQAIRTQNKETMRQAEAEFSSLQGILDNISRKSKN